LLSQASLEHAMKHACAEARRFLGATAPNPPVGAAALDAGGEILAVMAHQRAGEAHAEVALLEKCRSMGFLKKVAALCVTLEPCNHQGRTPPCAKAIFEAGIKHIVIGTRDPNPHVHGGGIEWLQKEGVEITLGVAEEECRQLVYAFATQVKTGQPWVTIKKAVDEKESMIPPKGQKTFTSTESLRLAHRLRKRADAIITGSGTILADDPSFTVRQVADHDGKKRFLAILDRRRRVPEAWLQQARERGLKPLIYDDIKEALADLARRGVLEVLVEAGPLLAQSVLESGLWDMAITIRKAQSDQIEVHFNPQASLPFDVTKWQWENMLPNES